MKKIIFLLILVILILPNINAEQQQQIIPKNATINIIGFGDINESKINISFKIEGSPAITYNDIPTTSNINEIREVLFIANLDCNETLDSQMTKSCLEFFNKSCDGFPCQSAYFVCKDDLALYEGNSSTISNLTDNLIICGNDKSTYKSEADVCGREKKKLEDESKNKIDLWIAGLIGIIIIGLCYMGWGRKKTSKTGYFSKVGEKLFGDEREIKPRD